MAVVTQYPYVKDKGDEDENFIKFYSDEGKPLIKIETGKEYEEAIDMYPSRFTYVEKEDEVPIEVEGVDENGRAENLN